MQTLECADCHKTFLHAAVLTGSLVNVVTDSDKPTLADPILEQRVCPFCLSLNIKEHEEPEGLKIVSLISVDIADVDAKLKEGYEVREVYAKAAVLQKKAKA